MLIGIPSYVTIKTADCPLREGMERLKEAGYDGADVTLFPYLSSYEIMGGGNWKSWAGDARAAADAAGLIIHQAHAPFVEYIEPRFLTIS